MTNLSGKFSSFEDQISSNHTEIMNALDTIATALGAPPPGPTTTLADVVTAIEAGNTILAGIRSDMNTKLDAIFNTVDTINNNASLNAQRLLSVLLQTACPCDSDVPILPPDLGTTPTSADDIAKCQRIQYFIDLYRSWVVNVAAAIGNSGNISSFQINNLMQLTLGDVGISTGELKGGMPTSIRDGLVGQIGTAIAASSASAINTGLFTAITTTANLEALRQALYGVTNASAGKAAADSAIDGLGLDPLIAGILKSMFYASWPNDIYSDVPIVDASAYDGEVCAPPSEGCTTLIDATYSGNNEVLHIEEWSGYVYYNVVVTASYGNYNSAIWVGGSLQHQEYGDYTQIWGPLTESFKFQASTGAPGGAHVFIEGCMTSPGI